jgi:D-arabinose 5-phosphate isomerase GutQ
MIDLTAATTKELADELAKREGIVYLVDPGEGYHIHVGTITYEDAVGPARILVVKD